MHQKRKITIDQDYQIFNPSVLLNLQQASPPSTAYRNKNSSFNSSFTSQYYTIPHRKSSKRSINPDNSSAFGLKVEEAFNQKDSSINSRMNFEKNISTGQDIKKQNRKVQKNMQQSCNIFENTNALQKIIKKQKIKRLEKTFIKKLGRTSSATAPIQFDLSSEETGLLACKGIELTPFLLNIMNLVSVFQIVSLLFVYTVSLVFSNLIDNNKTFQICQICSLFFYFAEIILNLVSIKSEAGKKIVVIKQIILYYMDQTFWIDLVVFLLLLIDISTNFTANDYLRLFIVCKLPECLHKIQKLEVYFIRNIYNEQYWELAKVFIVNFCIAHVICIFLAGMPKLNEQSNWMIRMEINNHDWIQQYIWSYYWAVNIMLTVGFGDISATNSSEALSLIIIQTFSCIVMAYNINCVGGIISNLRFENSKRSKKFKIFKKLSDQNYVPEQLQFQIKNYIEQSSNLKKRFNYEEEKQFMNELPEALRVGYLKESNHKIFKGLVFFRDLLDRTLYNFAEHLEIKVTHPQQIIRNIDSDFNLMILKEGQIGYICKKNGFQFNNEIVDLIKVKGGEKPFLTGLDFISKIRPQYEIKSLKFSVLYLMEYNRFIQVFKESDMDYEMFCFLRDKIRSIPDQFEVLPCQFCDKKFNHFKFTCPKLHYAPFEQHIINKELYKQKIGQNRRRRIARYKKDILSPIESYRMYKNYRHGYIQLKKVIFPKTNEQKQTTRRILRIMTDQFTNRTQSKINVIQLESIIDNKTREIIEMQLLRRQKMEVYEDEIWGLQLDVLQDFNSYFSEHNPHLLHDKFSPQFRQKRKLELLKSRNLVCRSQFNINH